MTPLSRKDLLVCEIAGLKALVPTSIRHSHLGSWLGRAGAGTATIAVAGVLTMGVAAGYVVQHAAVSSTGGHGTATAADDRQPVTVSGTTASGTALYPGGGASNLNFIVTNPNPRPLSITSISLTGSGNTTACALSLGTVSTPITITAVSGASQSVSLTGVLSMGNTALGTCMNQSALSVPLTLTVHD